MRHLANSRLQGVNLRKDHGQVKGLEDFIHASHYKHISVLPILLGDITERAKPLPE